MSKLFSLVIVFGFSVLSGCASQPKGEVVIPLSKDVVHNLEHSVFEVVVPKKEDNFVTFSKPLPLDAIPFAIRNDKFIGIGTAFAIGNNRYLSAAHVFRMNANSLWSDYLLRDAKGAVYKIGKIQKYANAVDMIEFDLAENIADAKPLEINDKIEVGDTIFTAGNAQGEGISYRSGVVSSFTPELLEGKWKYIRFSAPASPGNSGGPLLDLQGRVVGVVSMKNVSENLNFAVPMSQYALLPDGKAVFSVKNIQLKDGNQTLKLNWEATLPLPETRTELNEAALKSLKESLKKPIADIHEKEWSELKAPGFREFVGRQRFERFVGFLNSDGNDGNWRVGDIQSTKVEIGPDQHAFISSNKNGLTVVTLERPKDVSLEEFINNPKLSMDSILKASRQSFVIGNEKIAILSYGKPKESKWFKDRFGRPWVRSRWFFESTDQYAELNCSPTPSTLICISIRSPTSLLGLGTEIITTDQIEHIVFAYRGNIKQWEEFLKLKGERLPKLVAGSRVAIESKDHFQAKMGPYRIDYRDAKIAPEESLFYAYVGFAETDPVELRILGLNLVPFEHHFFQIYSVDEPIDNSPHWRKEAWRKIKEGTGHYDGEAYLDNRYNRIMIPLWKPNANIAHVVDCSIDTSEKAEGFAESCKKFKKGLAIR